MKIETLLATKQGTVLTIMNKQSLSEAIIIMSKHNIGALVVTDNNNALVGIISERDVVRGLASSADILHQAVDSFMTKHVVTGLANDDVLSVLQAMTEKHFRHLPILDQGKLIGIISIGDVVKAQLNEYQGQIDTLHSLLAESR
jgi:CBS domain-containing protein